MTRKLLLGCLIWTGVVVLFATTAHAQNGTAYRTPWGDPDLSGLWTNPTITPFERPSSMEGKPSLTPEEVAALEADTAAARARSVTPILGRAWSGPTTSSGWTPGLASSSRDRPHLLLTRRTVACPPVRRLRRLGITTSPMWAIRTLT